MLFDDGEVRRVGEAEGAIEVDEVADDGGIVEGVDDGDGLAGAVAHDVAEGHVAEAIGSADLGGSEAERNGGADGILHRLEVGRH